MKPGKRQFDQVFAIHGIGLVAVVTVTVATWFFGIAPIFDKSVHNAAMTRDAEEEYGRAVQAEAVRSSLEQNLQGLRKALDESDIRLLTSDQLNPLLADIASWSEAHQIDLSRANATKPVVLRYYSYTPVEISGDGQYHQLLSFIDKIQQERKDLLIQRLDIRRLPRSVERGDIGFTLGLAWYTQKPNDQTNATALTASVVVDP